MTRLMYEFQVKDSASRLLEGGMLGNLANWRKAEFVRPFSEAEQRLLTGGSVWNFEFDQGSFEVCKPESMWLLSARVTQHHTTHLLSGRLSSTQTASITLCASSTPRTRTGRSTAIASPSTGAATAITSLPLTPPAPACPGTRRGSPTTGGVPPSSAVLAPLVSPLPLTTTTTTDSSPPPLYAIPWRWARSPSRSLMTEKAPFCAASAPSVACLEHRLRRTYCFTKSCSPGGLRKT
jgi:hypothetical protein